METCFGIGYDLSIKNVNMRRSELCAFKMSQNMNITRKERRTEESIQGFGCIRRHGWNQEIIRGLIRKGKERKEVITKTLRNSKYKKTY